MIDYPRNRKRLKIKVFLNSILSGTFILTNSHVFAEEYKIPNWVRNVVKWWSKGQAIGHY